MSQTTHNQLFLIDFWSLLFDRRVTFASKTLSIGFIVIYFFLPLDLVPDLFLPVGLIDDGGFILFIMNFFVQHARKQVESKNNMSEHDKPKNTIPYDNGNQMGSGCTNLAFGFMMIIGFVVVVSTIGLTALIATGTISASNFVSSVGGWFNSSDTAQTTVPTRTIITSIQPLGQLVSISVEVAQADIGISINTGGINLCGHSANHVAQGVIEAGVDLTVVQDNNIQYDEDSNTYTLTIPSPTITSCRIEYIRQYERSGANAPCSVDWDTVRLLAQYEATSLFANDSLDAGILLRAERETTILMEQFVGALTGSEVEILYLPPTETALPASCIPQIPRGWERNAETGEWQSAP